ncbi:MAG: hypothetical protein KF690_06455 [Bacteroidetes bacterium]|nr:hypothetical protein [Bacteroidota bacterium]
MRFLFLAATTLLWLQNTTSAQSAWPVAVLDWQFGTGQAFGQEAAYFPANVLGPLIGPITPTAPASTPEQVVSLGRGGWIAVTFDPPIINGPGPDLTVFENAFFYGPNEDLIFDEWLEVAVSADGLTWHTFPNDCGTGAGMAGRTPTAAFGTDYQDPALSGGDSYDLQDLGLDTIRHVRVTDATACQTADRLAAELDGIVALNQVVWATSRHSMLSTPFSLRALCGTTCRLRSSNRVSAAAVYNIQGQCMAQLAAGSEWELPALSPGVYLFRARYQDQEVHSRFYLH